MQILKVDPFRLQAPSWRAVQANLAGVRPAVEVAGTQHVGADVGPIHLRAAALVVRDQGDQRLPKRRGVAAHVCRPTRGVGVLRLGWATAPGGMTLAPCPNSLSSWWPQPAIWHLCPAGKGLLGSGRQMGWTNWERTAQRSPFFSSRIRTGWERGRRSACRAGAVTAEGSHGVTRVQPAGPWGCVLGGPRELQTTFPLFLTFSLPPPSPSPYLSHPSWESLRTPPGQPGAAPRTRPGRSLTEVVVTGVEHRVQRVRDVLLDAKCLCHVRRAVEEVLAQNHGDALPGGAVQQGAGGCTTLDPEAGSPLLQHCAGPPPPNPGET